jgi:anti-sigma regulatory factor (Ser/Thr protein kinase)
MTPRGTDFLMPEVAALMVPAAPACPARAAAGGLRPVCRVFAGQPGQVGQARRFVRRVLAAGLLADSGLTADAVLLTSELAANAVQHTASGQGGTFAVTVCPCPPAVRICITDGGAPAGPSVTAPGPLSASGRGLAIVAALASRWGHHAGPGGRTVWFELGSRQ